LSTPFQWKEPPESQTLVFDCYQKTKKPKVPENPENQKTRKTRKPEPIPEVLVQISASSVSRGKIWIFINLTAPAYSPQLSASSSWIKISKFKV
jgi:hypothetical protein